MTTDADGGEPRPAATASPTPGRRALPSRPGRRPRRALDDQYASLGRSSIARLIVVYMLVALGAFVLCGVGLALAQRHAALEEAVRDAEVSTAMLASRVVQPALPRTPLDAAEVDQTFDQVVRERVLVAPITQVRILDEDGLVVYSTDSSLVGQQEPLTPAELDALRDGSNRRHRRR